MAGTRTFSFRAQADFAERHDRALAAMSRLRRERPRLADSARYDFDIRLTQAQQQGLGSSAERLRATLESFVAAVEEALADEHLMDAARPAPDADTLAAARASADAAARGYEDEPAA